MTSWQQLRTTSVVYEDEHIIALNKPSGIAVIGASDGLDIVTLAQQEANEILYPVHRIDKVTSGLILFAKDLPSHGVLTRQFAKRTVEKSYLALVHAGLPSHGTIDLPLSVGRKGRVRVAVPRDRIKQESDPARWTADASDLLPTKHYPSHTQFTVVWSDETYSVLAIRPLTGRRHQIRVHCAWIGYPILGDPLFATPSTDEEIPRTYLHSWRLSIEAPWTTETRLQLEATPDADFWVPLAESRSGFDATAVLKRARKEAL